MFDLDTVDYFNDLELASNPYPLLEQLAATRPVWQEPTQGAVIVTGHEEVMEVLRHPELFSSSTIIAGPTPAWPVALVGDDVTEQVEKYRDVLPSADQIVTFDPPKHTAHRAILMGLITPKRLKANEDFIWRQTDRQLDVVLPWGKAELMTQYAHPYALLVVADLLGVPEEDHEMLLKKTGFDIKRVPGGGMTAVGDSADAGETDEAGEESHDHGGLSVLYDYMISIVEDRRANPRSDVLTGMAQAKFPDGSTPEPIDVARIASNLFAAGQETTVRLMGACLQRLAEDKQLQQLLRENRELVPKFVEETLRLEGPIKGEFRVCLKTTTLGGVEIKAGTQVLVANSGANRDSRQFENPSEFSLERKNVRSHLAFGHGIHTCPGAPLARSEIRVTIERLLDRTSDISIDEEMHGPQGARSYQYMPTYMFRGLTELHLTFAPKA